jgi:hypothetical protein
MKQSYLPLLALLLVASCSDPVPTTVDLPTDAAPQDAPADTTVDIAPQDAPADTTVDIAPQDAPIDTASKPPPDVAPTCPTPTALCGGACVDLQSNALNCGACGRTCQSAESCVMGACRVLCASGQTACSGACVELQSNTLNCGACGRACPSGQGCMSGACVAGCPSPRATCGSQCVDLQSDPGNCAACGNVCAAGQSCQSGRCTLTCATGLTECAGRCVDTRSDNANCGLCGLTCASGQTCSGRACVTVTVPDAGGGGCVPTNLGSVIGTGVASGTTVGRPSAHTPPATCTDMPAAVSPDAIYAWTAPYGGTFTFDTVGSGFDTLLTLRSASCTGTALGCNDDIASGMTASRLSVALTAGQTVIVAVEGYGTNSGAFVLNVSAGGSVDAGTFVDVPRADAGGLEAGAVDPCGGVSIDGRCASASVVEYCSVPTSGGSPTLERFSCGTGERCALNSDGIATCLFTATCREGDEQCLGATQLRRCVGGSWVTQTCPRECLSSPLGDFCSANVAVRSVMGRVMYIARGPNSTTRPTDWSTSTFTVPAQSMLVLSLRVNADGSQSVFDATTTSLGNVDGGRFSLRVPTIATSSDSILAMAIAGDGSGGLRYVVANPGFTATGERPTSATPTNPTAWGWRWPANTFVSGDTLTITEAMGSGAARIFDYLRYAYQFARDQFARDGLKLVAWLQFGTSWSCGACMAQRPTTLFGSGSYPGERFAVQGYFDGSGAQGYWADPVTAHEFGHWMMGSYSASPSEGGRHRFGGHVYPGMAWSEGFATWFSSDVRNSSLYYDKQGSSFYWFDIAARQYAPGISALPWERPVPSGGLEQTIDENEVAAMLWSIRGGSTASSASMYRALASGRMQGPTFARGYRAWRWNMLDSFGDPLGAIRSSTPAPYLADFLDALLCNGFSRSAVDAATQPSLFYPYPSTSPLCF